MKGLQNIGDRRVPSRAEAALLRVKAVGLRTKRWFSDWPGCMKCPQGVVLGSGDFKEIRTRLWTSENPLEVGLEMGKVQNLRAAIRHLDGLLVPAGATFSFWRHVGAPSRRRGFAPGRALLQGCIVPSVGGGICQLTNSLYDLALQCGFEICERHRHSLAINPEIQNDRDATVAWNYIDLRFRSSIQFTIEAFMTENELVVRYWTLAKTPPPSTPGRVPLKLIGNQVGSCETCGLHECFRHNDIDATKAREGLRRKAFLLDAKSPEFKIQLEQKVEGGDRILLPLPKRLSPARYDWQIPEGATAAYATVQAMRRTLETRREGSPPETRLRQLEGVDRIARRYSELLKPEEIELFVDISLLQDLYLQGELGGRKVTVWAGQFPLKLVHEQLDAAARIYPDFARLSDF